MPVEVRGRDATREGQRERDERGAEGRSRAKNFPCPMSYHDRIISHSIISYHVESYRVISYRIISYHVESYRVVSYRIISCHVVPYQES